MGKNRLIERLGKELIFLDGAMGTMLQQKGLQLGERPDILSLTHPGLVGEVHRAYVESGAGIVYANTFGASAHKLQGSGYSPEQVIGASVQVAKEACAGSGCLVALDMGPLGELLEPGGSLPFEEAYADFSRQVQAGAAAGADLIVIETMTDLYEVKAALLAAREHSALPVFVSMTFEKNGRTFTGCSVQAMALTLQGLGADAMGINCSLGPGEIYPMARELCSYTTLPVLVKANAGLPDPATGEYGVTPAEFARQAVRCAQAGVTLLGGCCGTTPAYIRALRAALKGFAPPARNCPVISAVCTPTRVVPIDGVRVIGERINPTGKKRFKQALLEGDIGYILSQGIAQAEAGADILDVNVGLPGIDEAATMAGVVKRLQAVTDLPLQLDSSSPAALEAGLRAYNGKPIVNSVNGEPETLEAVLPLVKKYGAAVVGLTLDEKGIPETAERRLAVARRILEAALRHGIRKEDVYIDCLTLTVSVDQKEARETLRAVELVRGQLGLQTVLGVSNISFGLPDRERINRAFLTLALAHGLTLPILNPNATAMMEAVAAFNVLYGRDDGAKGYIAFCEKNPLAAPAAGPAPAPRGAGADLSQAPGGGIGRAIAQGMAEESRRLTAALLETEDEMTVINTRLIPALDEVGARFERGAIFLPQLLQAAGGDQADL